MLVVESTNGEVEDKEPLDGIGRGEDRLGALLPHHVVFKGIHEVRACVAHLEHLSLSKEGEMVETHT